MHIVSVYNTQNPEAKHSIHSLLMSLGEPIDVYLPNGRLIQGILREVDGNEQAPHLIKLIVEIDDEYETLYYIHHRQDEINQIQKYN